MIDDLEFYISSKMPGKVLSDKKLVEGELRAFRKRVKDCPDFKVIVFNSPALGGRQELVKNLVEQYQSTDTETAFIVVSGGLECGSFVAYRPESHSLNLSDWADTVASDWTSDIGDQPCRAGPECRIDGILNLQAGDETTPEKAADALTVKCFEYLRRHELMPPEEEEFYADPEDLGLGGW